MRAHRMMTFWARDGFLTGPPYDELMVGFFMRAEGVVPNSDDLAADGAFGFFLGHQLVPQITKKSMRIMPLRIPTAKASRMRKVMAAWISRPGFMLLSHPDSDN